MEEDRLPKPIDFEGLPDIEIRASVVQVYVERVGLFKERPELVSMLLDQVN